MLTEFVVTFGRLVASAIAGQARAVLVNVEGFADGTADAQAEGSTNEPLFGQLGVVARPRKPDAQGWAEFIGVRSDHGVRPIAVRDLRLNKNFNPAEGSVALVGYGGAFVAIDDAPSGGGSIVTLYAPFDFLPNGIAQQAHSIVIDTTPGNETIAAVHANGLALVMNKDGEAYIKNKAGDAMLGVNDDGPFIGGAMKLTSGAVVGDIPAAQPAVVASPAQLAWFAQMTVAMGQLAVYVNGIAPGTVTPVTAVPPVASTKLSASP